MKAKKSIVGLLLVCGIVAVFAANALAAELSGVCYIIQVGGPTDESGGLFVKLDDPKGSIPKTSFRIPANTRQNQVLAVLLTAASNGSNVSVKVDTTNNTLKAVYYIVD
jgi:hypothetical protein